MIRVTGIRVPVDERQQIEAPLLGKLRIPKDDLLNYRIYKESVDARKAEMIYFVYTVDAQVVSEAKVLARLRKDKDISVSPELDYQYVQTGDEPLKHRPVVIGTGPAGLFSGLLLAQMGYRPLLLERGGDVDERTAAVEGFWRGEELNLHSNVQFGEGGAGTFSDGKLTTLIKDKRGRKVLEELVLAGAPDEIIYSHKPHLGTDKLKGIVKTLRKTIEQLGGEVRFHSLVSEVCINEGKVTGILLDNGEFIPAELVVLAIGHSARDTFAMLYEQGVSMSAKPFSIGVRIEHPQELINRSQYGRFAGHPNLGAAEYKLVYHAPSGRSAYTFCMCPGGEVVAAASEAGCVCTNGMSEYARAAENANAALLVGVDPEDFGEDHPLAGIEFQRRWERKAYELGGRTYSAPAQRVGDFLEGRPSESLGSITPSYRRKVIPSDLRKTLPDYVVDTMQQAIRDFDRKLKGFAHPDALLTGVETRSSSPVRITRNDDFVSENVDGLYPCGEGAGYAGGIVSAAVDGVRVAEAIASRYRPLVN